MNKHLPVLIALLGFGLVGCAATYDDNLQRSLAEYNQKVQENKRKTPIEVEMMYSELIPFKALARPVNYGKGVKYGYGMAGNKPDLKWLRSQIEANEFALRDCESKYGKCLIYYEGNANVWELNLNPYTADLSSKNTEYLEHLNRIKEEERQRKIVREQEEKQRLIASLTKRCEDYGFTGDNNIAACIQREAQHDKELEMQKWELEKTRLALQQAQSRTYVQQQPEEEEVPLLIQMLGDIAVGVAEGYKNQQIYQQPQQKQSIYRNCKPNC